MSRSAILVLVGFAVVAVLARVFLLGGAEAERPRAQRPASEIAPEMPHVAAPTPGRNPDRSGALSEEPTRSGEDIAVTTMAPEAARAIAETLRRKARFPPTSRRIENNMDPIVETRAVKERLSPPGQGRQPTLVLFSSSVSYEAPNPIILFAKFIREYPRDWAPLPGGEIAGDLRNADGEIVAEVDLLDDGQGRDIEANDGIFTAQIAPEPRDFGRWNGLIRAQVYGVSANGDRREARTRFYYGTPWAKLTGNYRDELVDGHLELMVEVDAKSAGQYRIEATLSGSHGLLSWAEKTATLEPGLTWIPVTFFGLTLREAGEPGPYRLSSIALSNVTLKPPQLNDAISTQYETAAYKPEDFSAQPYGDPKLLQKADRYDARANGR
jgi:hypothetical protein